MEDSDELLSKLKQFIGKKDGSAIDGAKYSKLMQMLSEASESKDDSKEAMQKEGLKNDEMMVKKVDLKGQEMMQSEKETKGSVKVKSNDSKNLMKTKLWALHLNLLKQQHRQ